MREVVVTGIGMVSSAGEGAAAHLAALKGPFTPRLDATTFAPHRTHPIVALDYDKQIPKKSDQRQMELWQRLGCYAAGLALEAAGLKDDAALKARMHLIVAAGGGERDYAVDGQILTGLRTAPNPGRFLNERLMGDLRPTLFLAQLSNLLAGNISIVHGVTGASRTFMGEEQCAMDAIRIAHARIASGQNEIFLVGGSYNADRADLLLIYEMGAYLWNRPFASVWNRAAEGGGFILGSGAGFLVLEAREHAEARGTKAIAVVTGAAAERTRRAPGGVTASLARMWDMLGAGPEAIIVSGATGVADITEEEQAALRQLAPGARLYATGDIVGHAVEAQALIGTAIAAALIDTGEARDAVVTSVGHKRGEGLVRLAAPDKGTA
jgi:3-oxoacyl-[acyl-carrier-protein] synthase II